MHQIRAQHSDIPLKAGQDGLVYSKSLKRFLIGTGKQVFIMRHRQTQDVAKDVRQGDMHWVRPLSEFGSGALSCDTLCGDRHIAPQHGASRPRPARRT
jgi:hypothetical protein